jgi:hypothetical protein
MKSIEEKSKAIEKWCNEHDCNESCPLFKNGINTCFTIICEEDKEQVEKNYNLIFGQENDPVNHPSHYTKGKIEVADFIADQKLNFDRGNAVKYVCRAGAKDPEKEIQDLEKAIWYINHEIKMLKGECENAAEKEN